MVVNTSVKHYNNRWLFIILSSIYIISRIWRRQSYYHERNHKVLFCSNRFYRSSTCVEMGNTRSYNFTNCLRRISSNEPHDSCPEPDVSLASYCCIIYCALEKKKNVKTTIIREHWRPPPLSGLYGPQSMICINALHYLVLKPL